MNKPKVTVIIRTKMGRKKLDISRLQNLYVEQFTYGYMLWIIDKDYNEEALIFNTKKEAEDAYIFIEERFNKFCKIKTIVSDIANDIVNKSFTGSENDDVELSRSVSNALTKLNDFKNKYYKDV